MDDRETCIENYQNGDSECEIRYDPSKLIIVSGN